MIKKMVCILLIYLFIMPTSLSTQAGKGVDRSKFKGPVNSFPVTLKIGNSSFDGTLSRGNNPTDEEIEKAIKDTLEEMDLNELDIGDAERLVEKVAKDEQLTDEEIKEFRDNLLKVAGLDTLADVIDYVLGSSDKSFGDIAGDYALDEAKEKVLDIMMERVGEKAGGVLSKILDVILISSDQYEKDKEKWKNRAADAIAKRLLNDFYEKVREKIENQANQRTKDWELKIDTQASRNFSFYFIEGNMEICKVFIHLKKPVTDDSPGASGTYTGFVDITFDYEMSEYDKGVKDLVLEQSYFLEQYRTGLPGVNISTGDDYSPTFINRKLVHEKFSVTLSAPISKGMQTKTKMDFSKLSDSKMVSINHKVTSNLSYAREGLSMNLNYVVNLTADSDEEITFAASGKGKWVTGGQSRPINDKNTTSMEWDEDIWEQWKNDKWLTITYP